jgi:cyclopropane fatty-acyl-phospholipid synthase-like methyltransferase
MGGVEDKIVKCFKHGGGVPYEDFNTRFHEVMAEDSGQSVLSSLFSHILPLIPGITNKLRDGIDVMDLGCGRGIALRMLAKEYPNSRFIGYDLSKEAIKFARENAEREGLKNIIYEVKDLTNFDIVEKYDFITTFDAIHDQARPDLVLQGIYRALKDDGVYLMQDISASHHHHKNIDHPMEFYYTLFPRCIA